MFYRRALRPFFFSQDPETAHERTIEMLAAADGLTLGRGHAFTHAKLSVELGDLKFPNPVGLAAGCDKNARAVTIWPHFGFGFVEVGTITAQAQPGNPRPRVFRLPAQEALVNRLGFNSDGSEVISRRLARLRRPSRNLAVPLGINIGKTKRVSGDEATLDDYRFGFRRLARYADFVVVNVSSPNTPGLRQWQERDKLQALLGTLIDEARAIARMRGGCVVPLFVKISPDMSEGDMIDVAEVSIDLKMAGIIATNTTLAREGALKNYDQSGGLSGRPLRDRATEALRFLYRHTKGQLPLIGVGGIFSAEDAYARIQAGASLVQIYTGMVYEGPFLPRTINQGLLRLMERDGVHHIHDVVGAAV